MFRISCFSFNILGLLTSYNNLQEKPFTIVIPLCTVNRVTKVGQANNAPRQGSGKTPYGVEIVCKDLRTLIFGFLLKPENQQRKAIFEKLQEMCFPSSSGLKQVF